MKIKWKLLNENCTPIRVNPLDAAYDLRCTWSSVVPAYRWRRIPLGVCAEIEEGYYGDLTHRSSLFTRHGCILSRGIIDASYTGEIVAVVINLGDGDFVFKEGQRIAQIMFHPVLQVEEEFVKELREGKGGFGSSGE